MKKISSFILFSCVLVSTSGGKNEGQAWYSYGPIKIYRLYHPSLKSHHFTSDENEFNVLLTQGWRAENADWTVIR